MEISPDKHARHLRQWMRFPPQIDTVTLTTPQGDELVARVLDESYGGIGLNCDSSIDLRKEQVVRIEYGGAPMWAIVRRVEQLADGATRIGLEWTNFPPPRPAPSSM